jgi:hypothetical protein
MTSAPTCRATRPCCASTSPSARRSSTGASAVARRREGAERQQERPGLLGLRDGTLQRIDRGVDLAQLGAAARHAPAGATPERVAERTQPGARGAERVTHGGGRVGRDERCERAAAGGEHPRALPHGQLRGPREHLGERQPRVVGGADGRAAVQASHVGRVGRAGRERGQQRVGTWDAWRGSEHSAGRGAKGEAVAARGAAARRSTIRAAAHGA